MHAVRINKEEFIVRVRENRDNHRTVFETALVGYRARMERELERRLQDLRMGRKIDQYLRLPEPEDHTDDYDRILTMAEMSVDEVIELQADDFAMYVMDQWHWKQSFADSTARYVRAPVVRG